jgi:predicted nicotinamide N-methyase
MEEFNLSVLPQGKLSLKLKQQASFEFDTTDDSGMVVWGASVCLGRYLADKVLPDLLDNNSVNNTTNDKTTILELGCGAGIPCLVSCHFANNQHDSSANNTTSTEKVRVIASDQSHRTLQHVANVASVNGCHNLELKSLPWGKCIEDDVNEAFLAEDDVKADILLASEVVYSHESVPSLVETIDRFLAKPHGKAYVALRRDRPGVHTFFRTEMPRAGFVMLDRIWCRPFQNGFEDDKDLLDANSLPPGFQKEGGSNRWDWGETNYIYVSV